MPVGLAGPSMGQWGRVLNVNDDTNAARLINQEGSGRLQEWSLAGTVVAAIENDGTFTVTGGIAIDLQDDDMIAWGTDDDFFIAHRATAIAADVGDTDLAALFKGTSDHQAIANDSIIFSSVIADGDVLMLVNDGGNSLEFLHVDASAAVLSLGHGMATVEVKTASGAITLTPGTVVNSISAVALGTADQGTTARTGETLRASDMVGGATVDAPGADLTIAAGLGTGDGDVGTIIFSLPDQNGASNNTLQDRATRLTLDMVASTTVLTMAAAQALIISTAGNLTLSAAAGADVLIGDDATILFVDGGTGTVGIGTAAVSYALMNISGSLTAAGTEASFLRLQGGTIAAGGNNDDLSIIDIAPVATTFAKGTYTGLQVQQIHLRGLTTSTGSGTINEASHIRIRTAPTIGTLNYSIWVEDGTSRFDGDIDMNSSGTILKIGNAGSQLLADAWTMTSANAQALSVATTGTTTAALFDLSVGASSTTGDPIIRLRQGAGTGAANNMGYDLYYDSGTGFLGLLSRDIDGASADGVVWQVSDGANDVLFAGGISVDGKTAPTAGIHSQGNIILGTDDQSAIAITGGRLRSGDMVGGTTDDGAGTDLVLAAGMGTGNGDVGEIQFQLADINEASNNTIQSRTERLALDMAASTSVLTMRAAQAMTITTDAGVLLFDPVGAVLIGSTRFEENQGADVTAANNLVLGGDGNTFEITGATEIQLISNLTWQNGSIIVLFFTTTPLVKDGTATSSTNITLVLAGNADFQAAAGDSLVLCLREIGGTQAWQEISRTVV